MRKISILLLVTLLSFGLNAQSKKSSTREEVHHTVTVFFDGIAALDSTVMKEHTTKDFLLLEGGAVWNLDSLLQKLIPLRSKNFSRINQLDFIQIEVTGNVAWVAYHNSAQIKVNGQERNVRWLESAVLEK